MTLPIEITHFDGKRMSRPARTFDIGSGGMLFSADRELTEGRTLEYLTTLVDALPPVRIRCRGVILRVRQVEPEGDASFQVAVTIDRYEFLRPTPFPAAQAS